MNNMQLTIESSTTSMDLNDHQTGIYLVPELDGMTGLPEIRTSSGVNAGYDGGWTSAQNYDARLITIRGVIAHPVVSTVEAIRRQLVSLVGQGRKEALTLRLTTEAGNVYTVFVRTIACTMALQRVLTSQEFQIQFRADDPLIYDDGASSGTAGILRVQRALGGFEINFNLPLFIGGGSTGTPIENGGSETVYPIINLYGPLHSPTVINSTTNQQMQILADLAYEDNWQTPATASGSSFQITGIDGAPLTLTELKGNATQNGTPTPDAPVAVNTTTGENVVKITGKNLVNVVAENKIAYSGYANFTLANGVITTTGNTLTGFKTRVLPNTQYTAQVYTTGTGGTKVLRVREYSTEPTDWTTGFIQQTQESAIGNVKTSKALTTSATTTWVLVCVYADASGIEFKDIQLELGSTATSYEPYQGQEYTINLGSIELAKIGNYQDRIYKEDSKWYIEKQVGKVDLATLTWQNVESGLRRTTGITDIKYVTVNTELGAILAEKYTPHIGSGMSGATNCIAIDVSAVSVNESTGTPSGLAYYALATPTTTEITDSTLLSQLNFIANLYGGTDNIMLVGTGAQGEIEVEYMTENDVRRDVAVIDSQARTITINGSDAYHLKADGSEFITIAPGTNDMILTSAQTSDEGYAEIKYKQGYLSI